METARYWHLRHPRTELLRYGTLEKFNSYGKTGLFVPVIKKLIFCLLLASSVSMAGQGPAKLEQFLQHSDQVMARFEQSVLDQETAQTGRFQGVFYLSRPDKFRWDYSEPYEKVILADGDTVYIIDDDLEQVTYIPQQRALKGTPAGVLLTSKNLADRFEIIDIGESQSMDWVELIPRDEDSQFTRILVAFVAQELRRMEIADKFGQITRFQFYDIEQNTSLDKELFVFKRRQGFDMIGDY